MSKLNKPITKTCKCCTSQFETGFPKQEFCNKDCYKIYISHQKFPLGSEYVECKICHIREKELYQHIPKVHKVSIDQYCKQFNISKSDLQTKSNHDIKSQIQTELSKKGITGFKRSENNPAKSNATKSGRNSIWSMNFKGYDGLSDEEKIKRIHEYAKKADKTRKENNSYNVTLDFYIARGYSEKDAKKILSARQRTFSLEKCIEKHGIEEGYTIWKKRQEKW